MRHNSISRREFLRQSKKIGIGIGAGVALPNIFLNNTKAQTGQNPSEFIRIGYIGVGGQGKSNIRALIKNAVAVCDVDKNVLKSAYDLILKAIPDRKVATFSDYRKMLEDKSIDAILISTPDHWHTLPAAEAMMAGKDVYCEKPLTLTIYEGQVLVKIARKYNRILQTGSQQRSDPRFRKACEYVRSGRLGKIQTVRVGLPGVNWTKEPAVPDSEPPPELDYNMWLGPAPYRPYNKHRVHYYFRFFWDYSGGQMTNWGAHHLDIAQWGLGMDESGPIEIESTGSFDSQKRYEVPEKFSITYKYANDVTIYCESPAPKNGTTFIGEKGSIYVTRGNIESDPESILEEPLKETDVHLYESKNHHQNWLDCIKSRKLPICDVAIGHRSATVCHLGNISIRTQKKIKWDPAKEVVVGDAEVAKWVSKPYRAPWKLPTV